MMRASASVTKYAALALCLSATVLTASALASDQIGTITQLEGTVKIFTHPSKSLDTKGSTDTAPRALFEGEYYRVREAKLGDQVQQGNILRTAPQAKARVVFENGDQYNVGPGTAYRVFWNKDNPTAKAKIDLMYGKLRGMVTKGGPRSRLLIRTKSATMGVRGTDFFIATGVSEENGKRTDETEVSIIRGTVEVTPKTTGNKPADPIQVKAGYSAEVSAPAAPAKGSEAAKKSRAEEGREVLSAKAELRKTTQEALTGIQKSSEIKATEKTVPAKAIRVLEEKAVKAVISDMKATDPKLFAQVSGKAFKSTNEINHLAVETLKPEAPKAPPKRKPFKSEIEDLEDGAYEKYFKPATDGT